ncbi:hypothetical protein [Burkholderia contaminans]|uniref:hypothetical protein n=1 Tax=Burkholderia contaminans TaxID=488447 RepID=UPI00210EAAAD|nr:hypothetical protein [Burkholderia contaminans]
MSDECRKTRRPHRNCIDELTEEKGMYPRRSIVAAMLAVSAMGGVHAQTVSAAGYSLTVIGDLGGPRDMQCNGNAVSADGKTIVGSCWTDGDVTHAGGKAERRDAARRLPHAGHPARLVQCRLLPAAR